MFEFLFSFSRWDLTSAASAPIKYGQSFLSYNKWTFSSHSNAFVYLNLNITCPNILGHNTKYKVTYILFLKFDTSTFDQNTFFTFVGKSQEHRSMIGLKISYAWWHHLLCIWNFRKDNFQFMSHIKSQIKNKNDHKSWNIWHGMLVTSSGFTAFESNLGEHSLVS